MDPNINDMPTALAALYKVRDDLTAAEDWYDDATERLRDLIVKTRPQGLLTVGEMARAIERDRNYVDTVWSSYGETTKGRQTRVRVPEDVDPDKARWAYESLVNAARDHRRAVSLVDTTRAERDRTVALVYASKLLGPSAIATAAEIDRNHVLRVARKAGIPPMHRTGAKNQYTSTAETPAA